jgi:hypothetical protein
MRIIKIHFSHLRNEAHYQFFNLFRDLLIVFPSIMSLIIEFFDRLIILLDKESQLVDAMRSSEISKQLADADDRVDRIIVGINSNINAGLHHFDQQMVEAATSLHERMKVFGNIESKSYEEESAAVKLLISDLNGPYSGQVDTLRIREWIDELSLAEDDFERLFKLRNTERADKPDFKLKEIRKEIDVVYQQIVEHIAAKALVNPSGEYDSFIRELNKEVEYANEHSHRHARKDLGTGDHTVVEPIEPQIYTGKTIIVIPNVHYREEDKPTVELVFTVDFTVTYKNNIEVGTANLIIHGKGKYKGQKIVTFSIS